MANKNLNKAKKRRKKTNSIHMILITDLQNHHTDFCHNTVQ